MFRGFSLATLILAAGCSTSSPRANSGAGSAAPVASSSAPLPSELPSAAASTSSSFDTAPFSDAAPSPASTDDAGSHSPTVSCDTRALRCRIAQPVCEPGEVPTIVDGCYGDCVGMETCHCTEPEACPETDKYTCIRSASHCSPYLQ